MNNGIALSPTLLQPLLGANTTKATNPTCQVCLTPHPQRVPAKYREKWGKHFTFSPSTEELAARCAYLIEPRRFLISRSRQRGQFWLPLGVAHVMYGVTSGDLWDMEQSHPSEIREDLQASELVRTKEVPRKGFRSRAKHPYHSHPLCMFHLFKN